MLLLNAHAAPTRRYTHLGTVKSTQRVEGSVEEAQRFGASRVIKEAKAMKADAVMNLTSSFGIVIVPGIAEITVHGTAIRFMPPSRHGYGRNS